MLQRRPASAISPGIGTFANAVKQAFWATCVFCAICAGSAIAQERILWRPVNKTGFREVSTTVVSPTSSEVPVLREESVPLSSGGSTGGVIFTDPFASSSISITSSSPIGSGLIGAGLIKRTSLVEGFGADDAAYWGAPIGAIETTNDEFDYWLVDARRAPVEGDLSCGLSYLRFWHFAGGRWSEYSLPEFIAAMDPSLPTLFYVHGYGLGAPAAAYSTVRYACHISRNARKFRVITWAWGSRHNWLETPWENVQDKAWKAEVQGYYLARVLGRLSPDTEIALVGHSFGCRSVCAALQGLASGTICRHIVTRTQIPRSPYEATLIAAGVEAEAFAPGQRYCMALSQVHRMTITTNAHDRVLRLLEFVTGNPSIMGLHGPDCRDLPMDEAVKVRVYDVASSVWGGHRMGRYTWSNATVPALTPSILGGFSPESGRFPFFSLPW